MELKSFRELMSDCNEPWVNDAIENYKELRNKDWEDNAATHSDLYDALFGGFIWEQTPQGYLYWEQIAAGLKEKSSN
jgi:hypothetical protein